MVTKKKPSPKAKPKAKAAPVKPTVVAKKSTAPTTTIDPLIEEDESLLDSSGVFRVTTLLAGAQRGNDEDSTKRFPDQSLVMAAQSQGFRDEGPTLDDAAEDNLLEDEAKAERRARLVALAARR